MSAAPEFDPDFDVVYRIDASGTIHGTVPGVYAPDVQHDDAADILIDGTPRRESPEWHALTGHTGQYGYTGAVLHPSEQWGQWAVDALAAEADTGQPDGGVVFAIVEVRDEDGAYPDGDPIGWAVVYRPAITPGLTFTRDGATFTVSRDYLPGMWECRGPRGEIVIPAAEIAAYLAAAD